MKVGWARSTCRISRGGAKVPLSGRDELGTRHCTNTGAAACIGRGPASAGEPVGSGNGPHGCRTAGAGWRVRRDRHLYVRRCKDGSASFRHSGERPASRLRLPLRGIVCGLQRVKSGACHRRRPGRAGQALRRYNRTIEDVPGAPVQPERAAWQPAFAAISGLTPPNQSIPVLCRFGPPSRQGWRAPAGHHERSTNDNENFHQAWRGSSPPALNCSGSYLADDSSKRCGRADHVSRAHAGYCW